LRALAKAVVVKGSFRKFGGSVEKVAWLIPGGLCGRRGMPVPRCGVVRRVGCDDGGREAVVHTGEVGRGRITSGIVGRWEGPNAKPSVRTFVLVIVAFAQPTLSGPGWEGLRVKPEDARLVRTSDPAPVDTAARPPEAGLRERFSSRGNLAEALRRIEQNAGAGHRRDDHKKELR
jgi:hypothetical protein